MSEPQNSQGNSEVPDKDLLWGWWYKAKRWQNDLHRSAAYKALDIPEDMGDIHANKTYLGFGWREILAGGAVATALWWAGGRRDGSPSPPTVQPNLIPPVQPAAEPSIDKDTIGFLETDR